MSRARRNRHYLRWLRYVRRNGDARRTMGWVRSIRAATCFDRDGYTVLPWMPWGESRRGMWDESHRTSIDDCGDDRCPIHKSEGQCHLRRGHVGRCDPHGRSHFESYMEAAPGADGFQLKQ